MVESVFDNVSIVKSDDNSKFFRIDMEEDQDFAVEFMLSNVNDNNEFKSAYQNDIDELNEEYDSIQSRVDELDDEIKRYTNNADFIDYTVAVSSGILTGVIDSLFVGEFDFKGEKAKADEQVNKFIEKYAKLNGYKGDKNGKTSLNGAISFLEKKYPVPSDNAWKGKNFSSALSHHLDDFAHHPTPFGLICSVLSQLLRMGLFSDSNGKIHIISLDSIKENPAEFLSRFLPALISGISLWILYLVKKNEKLSESIPKPIQKILKLAAASPLIIQILKCTKDWFGHLVSDMGGSKNTAGGGMGIPGLFLSLLKEISALPGLNKTGLPKLVNDWYTKDKFDMRAEIAVMRNFGKQAIPVLINEALVRTFYFVRRLINEISICKENIRLENSNDTKILSNINWQNTLPFKNRTIVRMITIASGTFTAFDLADAAIRSSVKNGFAISPESLKDFVLRVNFVGVGRFAIALFTDVSMGNKKRKMENERFRLQTKQLNMLQAKIYYRQAGTWKAIGETSESIDAANKAMNDSLLYFYESWQDIKEDMKEIERGLTDIRQNDPDYADELLSVLEEW